MDKTERRTYVNSVLDGYADPGVLYYQGKYYLYSTSPRNTNYEVYVSDNLVEWQFAGVCLESAWGMARWYWAPEVMERDGKFYMIASVNEHLGIAVADSPLGPFVPQRTYLFDRSIDGHWFVDKDGTVYLYYVSWREGHPYGIYGVRMKDDIVTPDMSTEKRVLWPTEPWEKHHGEVTEGPYMVYHNGLYYLTYSGSGYTAQEYAIGYAISDSPLGEFKKYPGNPVLKAGNGLYGTGHHSFAPSPDGKEWFIVYHVHRDAEHVQLRRICIDRARFVPCEGEPDRLEVLGPTSTPQPYPSGAC
ncbi:MAG TPA: glycoside hydrolase family 43 protein [Bacillota bacterium]|nr:family 43 glycosylhydrolase [Clostridiales bacterium]HPT85868.1 glycoside hydrolase family 43 protein [Bacillota bacterium]